jgi:hypothetical protein
MTKKVDQVEIERIADGLLDTLRGELGLPSVIAERGRREQPMLVKDLEGNPSYWLVPVALEDRLLGFLRLGLEGDLIAYGRFGQAQQLRDFPSLSYLSRETADTEIRQAFGDSYEEISPPQLVHDGPVDRIAWLSRGRSVDGTRALLFWTFGTSYSRPEGEEPGYGLL